MSDPMDGDDLLHDKRPITQIRWNGDQDYALAKNGVVIEVYAEAGEYCNIAWLRVKRDGVVIMRMKADRAEVRYD